MRFGLLGKRFEWSPTSFRQTPQKYNLIHIQYRQKSGTANVIFIRHEHVWLFKTLRECPVPPFCLSKSSQGKLWAQHMCADHVLRALGSDV